MDKRINGLAGAMREIAEQRDKQLRDAKAIPADRLEHLNAFLTVELPVETALFAAARRVCSCLVGGSNSGLPHVFRRRWAWFPGGLVTVTRTISPARTMARSRAARRPTTEASTVRPLPLWFHIFLLRFPYCYLPGRAAEFSICLK